MKILQVYPYFFPAWGYGGVTRVAYEISKHLVDRGHDVSVYTTDALDKSRITIKTNPTLVNGIKTYYFRNLSNSITHKYHLSLPLEMPFRIKKEVKKFNIIHLHGYRHSLNVLIHHFAKKYQIPYVLKAGGSLPRIHRMHGIKRIFDSLFGYRILQDADTVIARNKREVEQYRNMGVNEDRIEVIPAGIDISKYDNLPQKGVFRRKYSINDEEKVVLYLGRIHRIKGLDLLVKTFAGLLNKLDNVRLAIVGPDDGFISVLRAYIRNLRIDNKVLFTGPLYERDKLEAYVDADAYVLPSRYEIFGITILEAWACGTPVIVTDRCGIADLVNKVGYVVEYDKNQLQDAIFKILNDDELRKRLGVAGKKLVKEEFSWDNVVGKIERLYTRVLAK